MIKYTIRRFITMLFTLFIIATATFFLLAAVPGDALSARAERLPENIKENLYKKYGPVSYTHLTLPTKLEV